MVQGASQRKSGVLTVIKAARLRKGQGPCQRSYRQRALLSWRRTVKRTHLRSSAAQQAHFRALRGVTFGVTHFQLNLRLNRIIVIARLFESLSHPVVQQLATSIQPPCNGEAIEPGHPLSNAFSTRQVSVPRIPLASAQDDTSANTRRIQKSPIQMLSEF
jgi:hypothetical protein